MLSPYPISNAHTPFNNVDGKLTNIDNSHTSGIPFSNTVVPNGPHTLPPTASNVQSAMGIYPGRGGGKRKRKNKLSTKYNMSKSRRRGRMSKRYRRKTRRHHKTRRHRRMYGGAYQPPATAPSYPGGHSQYLNNNGSVSNTYSVGGPLNSSNSALANPPPYQKVAGDVDNLNRNTLNSHGNIGAGSGFASRGWF